MQQRSLGLLTAVINLLFIGLGSLTRLLVSVSEYLAGEHDDDDNGDGDS